MIQFIQLSYDFSNTKNELMVFESQIEASKKRPKVIFKLDSQTEAKQIPSILSEQYCLIISSGKGTLTFSCDSYGELLEWISKVNRAVSIPPSKVKKLPPIPSEDSKKEFKRGSSDPGKIRCKINEVGTENKSMLEDAPDHRSRQKSIFTIENNSIYGGKRKY